MLCQTILSICLPIYLPILLTITKTKPSTPSSATKDSNANLHTAYTNIGDVYYNRCSRKSQSLRFTHLS